MQYFISNVDDKRNGGGDDDDKSMSVRLVWRKRRRNGLIKNTKTEKDVGLVQQLTQLRPL